MVIAYFQNVAKDINHNATSHFIGFVRFYAELDEEKQGIQIDLNQIFPDDERYSPMKFAKLIALEKPMFPSKERAGATPCLYLKDPIGKIYYSDPTEYFLYRENTAESAFDYRRVKAHFI